MQWHRRVDAVASATTNDKEIGRNPHAPSGLQAASAHLFCSGSSTMPEHRLRRHASHLD